jgi:GTP pyrophosphokinase
VNGKLVPLHQELKTGDQVEILTAKRGGPSRDWLNSNLGLVKTQRARSKIKAWFKKQEDEQNLAQGRATLERELQRLGIPELNFDTLARDLGYKASDEFFIALGCGDLPLSRVIRRLSEKEETTDILAPGGVISKPTSTGAIEVVGLKDLLSQMAKCCNPAPGDQIVGYITRGRGATIHRQDCPNMLRIKDKERLLQVDWGKVENTYPVPIKVKAFDRQGLMVDISTLLDSENINIVDISVNVNRTLAVINLVVEVKNLSQLSRILTRLENLPNVLEAHRTKPG